jgi:hypothetical protein
MAKPGKVHPKRAAHAPRADYRNRLWHFSLLWMGAGVLLTLAHLPIE